MNRKRVVVYGADWCPVTRRALAHLTQTGVPFEYINIEKNSGAASWVRRQNHGKEIKPTIEVDGQILSEPANEELDSALGLRLDPGASPASRAKYGP